jgi:hypothetical protein
MNIDELVRDADPALRVPIPAPDSALARRSFERVLAAGPAARRRGDRLDGRLLPGRGAVPGLIAAVAAAGLAISLIAVLPGAPAAPAFAAARLLDQAAAAAARSAPLVLRPGQYLYTETRSGGSSVWVPAHGGAFYTMIIDTAQVWQTAAGAGETITTYSPDVTFLNGTRKNWIADGRPAVVPRGLRSVSWAKAGSGDAVPLDNLSRLPTSPAALLREIEDRKTGLADINADVEDPATPGGAFYAAMQLLTEPSVGGSPALRAALFRVMASLPGDAVIGRARTRSGRGGIAIRTPPLGTNGSDIFRVIIDPASGQVLEVDEYARAGGADEQWGEMLATAVVSRPGQLPGH